METIGTLEAIGTLETIGTMETIGSLETKVTIGTSCHKQQKTLEVPFWTWFDDFEDGLLAKLEHEVELLLSPEHLDEPDQVRVLQVLERVDPTRIAAMLNFCMYMTIELSQLMLNL